MGWMEKTMAARCEHCPLCRYARKNPDTWIGKVMDWHGKWCPFWKAWKKNYENKDSGNATDRK